MFAIATTGIVAFLAWKLVMTFLLPLLGVAVVAVLVVLKIAFWIGVVCFFMWLYKRMNRSESVVS